MGYGGRVYSLQSNLKHCERWRDIYRKRAERLSNAWDTMREVILHQNGPLEVNDVLAIIDEHDPREDQEIEEARKYGEGQSNENS